MGDELNSPRPEYFSLTLRTGASIGQGLDGRQIRNDVAGVPLVAAPAGRCAGRDGASRKRSSSVPASSVVPERRESVVLPPIRLLLDRAIGSILLRVVNVAVFLVVRDVHGDDHFHATLSLLLQRHLAPWLSLRQVGTELAEYGPPMGLRHQAQTFLEHRGKDYVIGIAIAATR